MAFFGIFFLTLCFTFCFVSSEDTVSVKESTSELYTVFVVCKLNICIVLHRMLDLTREG